MRVMRNKKLENHCYDKCSDVNRCENDCQLLTIGKNQRKKCNCTKRNILFFEGKMCANCKNAEEVKKYQCVIYGNVNSTECCSHFTSREVVAKGGSEEYIKNTSKSDVVVNGRFCDQKNDLITLEIKMRMVSLSIDNYFDLINLINKKILKSAPLGIDDIDLIKNNGELVITIRNVPKQIGESMIEDIRDFRSKHILSDCEMSILSMSSNEVNA